MSPAAIAELHQFFLRLREICTSDQFHQMRVALSVMIGAKGVYDLGGERYYIKIRGLAGDAQ